MNNKKLTIGIPTFNGEIALEKNLENLVSIIEKNNIQDSVNILVSINASIDNSKIICEKYNKMDFFSYYCQKKNIGYDRNVDSVVHNAVSPYIWLLSDDDTITEKGLINILNILEEENPSYIFVNNNNSIKLPKITGYEAYDSNTKFVKSMKLKSGLISSNIIQRELWMRFPMKKYIDSSWIHMGYIIELLNLGITKKVVVYDTDYIKKDISILKNRWGSNGTFLITGLFYVNMFINNLDKENRIGLYYAKKNIAGAYPRNIFIARYYGFNLTKSIKQDIKKAMSYNYIKYFVCVLPVILMSDIIIKVLGNWIKRIKHTVFLGNGK